MASPEYIETSDFGEEPLSCPSSPKSDGIVLQTLQSPPPRPGLQAVSSPPATPRTSLKRRRVDAQKKLFKPFRSPLISRNANVPSSIMTTTPTKPHPHHLPSSATRLQTPLSSKRTSDSPTSRLIALQSRLRALNNELQTARQALTYETKQEDDNHLAELSEKWRRVSREVVYRLYDLWKEKFGGQGQIAGQSDGLDSSWGWDNGPKQHQQTSDQEEEKRPLIPAAGLTMAIMMNEMGINPHMLGNWDTQADNFV